MREAIRERAAASLPPPLAALVCSMLPNSELRGGPSATVSSPGCSSAPSAAPASSGATEPRGLVLFLAIITRMQPTERVALTRGAEAITFGRLMVGA
jgi:hypothetical protein